MTDYFNEDEIYSRRSPGLEQVYVKAAPSPSPPPVVTNIFRAQVKSPSSRRPMKAKSGRRRKTLPTQGDWVLIREMAPNQPEIAHQVSQHALNSDSESHDSSLDDDDDDDMEGQSPCTAVTSAGSTGTNVVWPGALPSGIPHLRDVLSKPAHSTATSHHRDSVVELDVRSGAYGSDRRPSEVSSVGSQATVHSNTNELNPNKPVTFSKPAKAVPNISAQRRDSSAELATSLHQLQIPQNDNIRLPSIQAPSPHNDAPSPNTQQLPPIADMVENLPRSASVSEEVRTYALMHRHSISSAQSPIARQRQASMSSSQTPASPYPMSASSPMSTGGDMFLLSSPAFLVDRRRPSHASETGRIAPSSSTSEGYQSSEGPSPGSQPSPIENRQRLMSIDGTLTSASAIILPVPNGSGIQQMGSSVIGTFRCEYSGCNALPFQTQYLLK
jgi:hypothetical protein